MNRNLHAGRLASGGLSLNILTDDELNEIHLATLETLEKAGKTRSRIGLRRQKSRFEIPSRPLRFQ